MLPDCMGLVCGSGNTDMVRASRVCISLLLVRQLVGTSIAARDGVLPGPFVPIQSVMLLTALY